MRLFIGSLLCLLFVTSSVYGQLTEIKVDGSSMPGVDVSSVMIDENGVMTISSQNGDYEINKTVSTGDVTINSFRIDNLTTANLAVGETVPVSWGTSNADSCVASTDPADQLAGWTSTTVIGTSGPLVDGLTFPDAGTFNLRLDCFGSNGSTDTEYATAKVGAAAITNFAVSPNTADTGADLTLTFSWASANTDSCYGSWPNSDGLLSSGTDSTDVTNIQPGAQYTLTCISLYDEAVSTVAVTVTDPAPTCDVTLTSRRLRNWNTIFGAAWPAPASRETRVSVPDTGYYAVAFDTEEVVDTGAVSTFEASSTHGQRILSISEIPGCFDVPRECKAEGRTTGIGWNTTGSGGGCHLKSNTTYYWNVTFTDGETPGSSTCLGTECETYLWVINSD